MTNRAAILQQINHATEHGKLDNALALSISLPDEFSKFKLQNTIAQKQRNQANFEHSMSLMIRYAQSPSEKTSCMVAMADYYRIMGNAMKSLHYYGKAFRADPSNQALNFAYLKYSLKQLHATEMTLQLAQALIEDSEWAANTLYELIAFAYRFNNKNDLINYYQLIKRQKVIFTGTTRIEVIEFYIRAQLTEEAAELRAQYIDELTSLELTILDSQTAISRRDFKQALELIDQLDHKVLNQIPYLQYARGNTLISLEQFDQGFSELLRASQAQRQRTRQGVANSETSIRNLLEEVRQVFTPLASVIGEPQSPLSGPAPIFMVGFPRSGTTLLERMIDTHPQLMTINEKPMIDDTLLFMEQHLGLSYPQSLPTLSLEAINRLRQRYWEVLHKMSAIPDGVTPVDKHPWAINQLPLIAAIFPDAKVIVCTRHPMDCVYSCFRQLFVPSFENNQIITINECAHRYVEVMDFYDELKPYYPFSVLEVAYENVVKHSDEQVTGLYEFLEVPFDEGFKHFNEHAKKSAVTSASLYQVTQPLYTSAIHSWSPIETQLQEPLKILSSRIDLFSKIIN